MGFKNHPFNLVMYCLNIKYVYIYIYVCMYVCTTLQEDLWVCLEMRDLHPSYGQVKRKHEDKP